MRYRSESGKVVRLWGFTSAIVAIIMSLIVAGTLYARDNGTTDGDQPATSSLQGGLPALQQASAMGAWASPADLCASGGQCLVGAIAVVLFNGKVLFIYYPAPASNYSAALVLDPNTRAITDVTLPFQLDIFCSGMSIMPNGQVMVTGGNNENSTISHSGTTSTVLFNPNTSTWTLGQEMSYTRWYPSTLELADGTMLELSGNDDTGTVKQKVMETYAYVTNSWKVLPASANMPPSTLHWTAYPRMAVLPTGKVLLAAPDQQTYEFDPSANTWSMVATTNFGPRFFAPHVQLPGLQKVLVAGGTAIEGPPGGPATNTAEIFDSSLPTPAWSYTGSMTYARVNENLVLLADGTVLAIGGGGGSGSFLSPVLTPELYDPNTGKWTLMAPQIVQRTYHSTAILLPDGRVLSAGSNDHNSLEQTYEIFSPPYLFRGSRPTVTSAPTSLTYGAKFTFATAEAASITRVALIRPGSTTHADDFDQRYVDLTFTLGSGQITATAPASGNYAPPGYYMLVIVNSSGVPSIAHFLKLD